MEHPEFEIRARHTDTAIRVYQAYSSQIAEPALRAQRFVAPFGMSRMTWIKPSFLWMMYRSNWGSSEGQERVLAIDIDRAGFEWALDNACLSHFDQRVHESPDAWKSQLQSSCVRIQWDPERDFRMERLPYRAIQIGLSGEAVERFVRDWIRQITDLTTLVAELSQQSVEERRLKCEEITSLELPYAVTSTSAARIGIA